MPALPTKIVTDLRPDDAHVQTASTPFDAQDRQKIDTQILGCQQHIADSLLNGTVGTWVRVASTSATLAAGDVVCLAGVASGEPTVTLATAAAIAGPGAAYGVVLQAASPGARARIAIDGLLGPSITGLASTAGMVRVSSVGRPERVASYSTGDYPIGAVSAQGYLTISRGPAIADSGGSADVDPTADTLVLRGSAGEAKAARIELGSDTVSTQGDIRGPEGLSVYGRVATGGGQDARLIALSGTSLRVGDQRTTPRIVAPASGDVELAAGGSDTVFARVRSTSACAQVGDIRIDPTTGRIYHYVDGSGEQIVAQGEARYVLAMGGQFLASSGATVYFVPGLASAQTTMVRHYITRACNAVALAYSNTGLQVGSGTTVVTLCKVVADVAVDTSLTMTITSGMRRNMVTGSVALAQDDEIVLKAVGSGTISSTHQWNNFAIELNN